MNKANIKTIKDSETKEEMAIPVSKAKRMLAIILKENKSTIWKWVSFKEEMFKVGEHTYFIVPEGAYLSTNRVIVCIYLEGISTPLSHKNVVKHTIKKKIKDATGKIVEVSLTIIKGLKYDSKIIDMLLNRNLADEFTKTHMDLPNLIIVILLLVSIIVGIANLGVQFA